MVTYERRGPVAVIGIGRPGARHAVDAETAWALNDAWHRFAEDDDADVGVLVGDAEAFELEVELGREASPIAREEAKRFLSGEFEPVEEP